MKKTRKFLTVLMALVMIVTIVNPVTADAAAKPKLNKTKVTLTITNKKKNPTVKLKAKNATGKVKWSTSDKKVATVKNGKVTVKSAGKATITCKVNKKKLTCKVTVVKDKRTNKNDTKGDLKVEIKQIDSRRTSCHNSVIVKFDMLARYVRMQGKDAKWRDRLGDEKENPYNRKRIGDFACYLVFINSLNAR